MIKELKARFDSPEEAFAFFDDHKSGKISRTQVRPPVFFSFIT